jgi:hypothetical protein
MEHSFNDSDRSGKRINTAQPNNARIHKRKLWFKSKSGNKAAQPRHVKNVLSPSAPEQPRQLLPNARTFDICIFSPFAHNNIAGARAQPTEISWSLLRANRLLFPHEDEILGV